MSNRPDDSYFETMTPELRYGIWEKLRKAYDVVIESHNPDEGFNENTFGITLYHVAAYQLSLLQSEFYAVVKIDEKRPKFRVSVGPYQLACYRVGKSPADDISECFPRPESSASDLVPYVDPRRLLIPQDQFDALLVKQRTAILSHIGNSESGLMRAYICFPVSIASNGQIDEWGFIDPLLHEMPPPGRLRLPTDSKPPKAPEEIIPKAELSLSEVSQTDAGNK